MNEFIYVRKYMDEYGHIRYECICEECGRSIIYRKKVYSKHICAKCRRGILDTNNESSNNDYQPNETLHELMIQEQIVNSLIEVQTILQLLVSKGIVTHEEILDMRNKIRSSYKFNNTLDDLKKGKNMLSEKDKSVVDAYARTGMSLETLILSFPKFDKEDVEKVFNEVHKIQCDS